MTFDNDQRGIMLHSALALLVAGAVLGAGYGWLPPEIFGLTEVMPIGDQIGFVLKASFPIFLWLAACVRTVASGRFRNAADRPGAAFGPPSEKLAIRIAILQNSLEQTVLILGAHLILAVTLRGTELVLVPLSVGIFLAGRAAFAWNYRKGAVGRAFGMTLTAAPIIFAYILAGVLMLEGR